MFDEEIHSNSEGENETYENFKFRKMIKELSEDIADSIVDFLDSNKDENGIKRKIGSKNNGQIFLFFYFFGQEIKRH